MIFRRVTTVVVGVVAIAVMLTTFPQVRTLGASMLASAGIAGIVLGFAAQQTLSNLLAGVQIALTEPIRLDDVVVIEHWTRTRSQILWTVLVHADYSVPMGDLRAELDRIVRSTPLWDGRVALLQAVEAHPQTMELRALVSAHDAPGAWDLRCVVRERPVAYLRRHHPESLPRVRAEVATAAQPAAEEAVHGSP